LTAEPKSVSADFPGTEKRADFRKAADHDMNPSAKLIPSGIPNVLSGVLSIFFGTSSETGDF